MRLASLLVAVLLVVPVRGQEASRKKTSPTGPKPAAWKSRRARLKPWPASNSPFPRPVTTRQGTRWTRNPSAWFAAPFDLAYADDKGIGDLHRRRATCGSAPSSMAGRVSSIVTVRPQAVARVTIAKPRAALAVGTGLTLHARAEMANGDPRTDQQVKWVSLRPDVASDRRVGICRRSGHRNRHDPGVGRQHHGDDHDRGRQESRARAVDCAKDDPRTNGRRRSVRELLCLVRPTPVSLPSRAGRSVASARRSMPMAFCGRKTGLVCSHRDHRRTIRRRHGHCGAA